MTKLIERNLGEQPLAGILKELDISAKDLVAVPETQLTFKMVARACKGRRLTAHSQAKLCEALQRASGRQYARDDLFTY
ncbi:MAG: hypothetical protein O3A51_02070 [Verrucomicrobia bacterium]|nr:hypothetical protein [Verrucomicrobiota bacterium]